MRVRKSRDEASARATTLEGRLRESRAHAAAADANVQAMRHAVDMERWHLQQQRLALDDQQRRHADELARCAAVLSQASFYFSPANLQRDEYLRSHMQHGTGFVSLHVLLTFPRMSRRALPPDGVLACPASGNRYLPGVCVLPCRVWRAQAADISS